MSENGDKPSCTKHPTVNLEAIDLLEKLTVEGTNPKNKDEMSISSELVRLTSASENQI
jgi:hypothetical protein